VEIGGTAQTATVDSDNQITIPSVDPSTPTGVQNLVVQVGSDSTPSFSVTVIHLVLNEVDPDQMGTDAMEFIEVSAGIDNVDLSGYTVVLWNGNGDVAYEAFELSGMTDANGFLVVGPAAVSSADIVVTPNTNLIQNGDDGVSIHQGVPASFDGMAVTAMGLIDAVVYDSADAELTTTLLGAGGVAVDENANFDGDAPADTTGSVVDSLSRCGDALLDGSVWVAANATPDAANACP
jgi:hypothetical protein